jgi:hypothetical protein
MAMLQRIGSIFNDRGFPMLRFCQGFANASA